MNSTMLQKLMNRFYPRPPRFAYSTYLVDGARVSWSHVHNVIAYDTVGADDYYNMHTIAPDGTNKRSITTRFYGHTTKFYGHVGNPEWHPSGDFIVFQAQDVTLSPLGGKYQASPGIGVNNNLWITNANASNFWQLTSIKAKYGVLHPHFSPDGNMLAWSQLVTLKEGIGQWAIKLAHFSVVYYNNGEPRITNVKTLFPADLGFYEVHGFSPDGKALLFSGVPTGQFYWGLEMYSLSLKTYRAKRLTMNNDWDEHAQYTPDGKWVIWASSRGIQQIKGTTPLEIAENPPRLDYWIMRPNGRRARRLTYFNELNTTKGVGVADFDIGPCGTMVAKLRIGYAEKIMLIKLMKD